MNRTLLSLARWLDGSAPAADLDDHRIDWVRNVPFLMIHAA
ncbi:MAG: hypothetical protein ACYTE6_00515 [Planctomycetota bacterium]|jgi:hypothetical protein